MQSLWAIDCDPVSLFAMRGWCSGRSFLRAGRTQAYKKKAPVFVGLCFLINALLFSPSVSGQIKKTNAELADTSLLYDDEILGELALLLDDIKGAKSFGVFNLGMTNAYFSFQKPSSDNIQVRKKILLSPSLAYYHKSGFGIAAESNLVNDGRSLNPYQFSLTGSYDYLKNRNFATGVLYSRYFDKKDLPFYTSPLQNDALIYFTYRKQNFRPSVNLRYGWGSQQAVSARRVTITKLHKKRNQTVSTIQLDTTSVNVSDLNLTTSLRYYFSFPGLFTKGDYFRIVPQLSLISGTQQYGFNAVSSSSTISRGHSGKITTTEVQEFVLYNDMRLRPLLLTAFLRTEYTKGRFFIQPQMAFDYSFTTEDKFSTSFSINTGIVLY